MAADAFGSLSGSAYKSPGTISGSAASNFTETDKPGFLGGTGVNANKLTEAYDPTDQDGTSQIEAGTLTDAPPVSPNSWLPGHDYYKNNGMEGQDFFDNQG